MSSKPKATYHDPNLAERRRDNLGDVQPLAVMEYSPEDTFPGVHHLARRRRLTTTFLSQPFLRVDSRVPLSIQKVNRSHDALVYC